MHDDKFDWPENPFCPPKREPVDPFVAILLATLLAAFAVGVILGYVINHWGVG